MVSMPLAAVGRRGRYYKRFKVLSGRRIIAVRDISSLRKVMC
jgi:hypothetical protein